MHRPELQDHKAPAPIANPLLTVKQGTWGDDENPKANKAHGAEPDGHRQEDKGKIEKALPSRDGLILAKRS